MKSDSRVGSRTATLIAIALVAAAVAWMFTRPDTIDTSASGNAAASSHDNAQTNGAAPSRRSESKHESPQTSPTGGVVLPSGGDQVGGLATRFPDTDLGAVATQVAVCRAQIGFDYDTATKAVKFYAAPAEVAVFEQRARLAVADRSRAAGVPVSVPANVLADGEVPAPASYAVTPVAYHLLELSSNYYAVTLLSYITLTTAGGQSKDGFYAGTGLVKWVPTTSGGDWKLTEGTSADVRKVLEVGRPNPAAPGTEKFTSEGWVQLNPEQP